MDSRSKLARKEAKALVARLKERNEQAAQRGLRPVPEDRYAGLEKTLAKKLARS
jgi:hypothetical protein